MGTTNSRILIRSIVARTAADRCGFWLGNLQEESLTGLHSYFGTSTLEELHQVVGSDFRWLSPQYLSSTYRHPHGRGLFDLWKHKHHLGEAGPFSAIDDVDAVHAYKWPRLEDLDFSEGYAKLSQAGEYYRASGFWMPFFRDVMDLFGMDSLLTRMYTNPDVVHAAFEHVCGFYRDANERFFNLAGAEMDAVFFGNDFGTQRDLLLSPRQFDEFVLPWIKTFTDQAHAHGYGVILHSGGSIARIMGRLIDAGIDCLHPLQTRASNMDAQTLARTVKGRIAFMGGIDTQHLLVQGTVDDVKREVRRLKFLLGPHLIISPSHEALLPNVPPRNVAAMAEAALE